MDVTDPPQGRRSTDTEAPYRARMATLGDWLLKLGNTGAVRNAAAVVAQRRAAEARANATLRQFNETAPAASRRFGSPTG